MCAEWFQVSCIWALTSRQHQQQQQQQQRKAQQREGWAFRQRVYNWLASAFPCQTRHFGTVLNSGVQHGMRYGAMQASRELYAGVVIATRFERSATPIASIPLDSPMPLFGPARNTCSAWD
jgi:hypothetical protein